VLSLLLDSCTWDNQDEFYPPEAGCDTLEVSFSADIQVLLDQHCWACHSNQNAPSFGNGLRLEDHLDVAGSISLVISAMKHEAGVSPMPKASPKLDECTVAAFEAWENQGSKDN
jgi:mono/diheme cytochrome c family protein